MRPSFRLGTISGIRVGLHWSVALVAVLFTSTLAGSILPESAPGFAGLAYLTVALSTATLFLASIVAHEFGHSIVARRNGVGIKGITLFALGGVAVMDSEPDRPGPAFRMGESEECYARELHEEMILGNPASPVPYRPEFIPESQNVPIEDVTLPQPTPADPAVLDAAAKRQPGWHRGTLAWWKKDPGSILHVRQTNAIAPINRTATTAPSRPRIDVAGDVPIIRLPPVDAARR